MKRAVLSLTTMAAALMVAGGVALAASQLDQQNTDTSSVYPFTVLDRNQAQTFTAGTTGDLDKVSVYLMGGGDVTPTAFMTGAIYPTDSSGKPLGPGPEGDPVLGWGELPLSSVPQHTGSFTFVDIPLNIQSAPVKKGTVYALLVSPFDTADLQTPCCYVWGKSTNNPYPRGSAASFSNGTWNLDTAEDFLFKTFVIRETIAPTVTSVAPIEEPAARNTDVTATFSEEMDPATLTTSTIKMKAGKKKVPVGISYDEATKTVTLDPYPGTDPPRLLAANKTYKVVITTGVKDQAGNALDQDPTKTGNQGKSWTFTTGG